MTALRGRLTRGVRMAIATFVLWDIAFVFLDQARPPGPGDRHADAGRRRRDEARRPAAGRPDVWAGLPGLLTNRYGLGAALVLLAGDIAATIGRTSTAVSDVAVVTAVSSCHPASTILLAVRRLREDVRLVPLRGATITILGVVALPAA